MRQIPLLAVCLLLLAACGGPGKRDSDGIPRKQVSARQVKDAKPMPEPRSRYGNHSPYEVLGKRYHVMASADGYQETGVASWYGKKFHGRKTSSGEPFDMYKATAAHRSLPLPTYAEVTSLDNGRSIIVKINDRGPFAHNRLIDLSYGAAVKLDMIGSGTARVRVRAINFDKSGRQYTGSSNNKDIILQVGAFREKSRAKQVKQQLSDAGIRRLSVESGSSTAGKVYRVWIGPLKNNMDIERIVATVLELGLDRPHQVRP